MSQFAFLNTKRSRALSAEVWLRVRSFTSRLRTVLTLLHLSQSDEGKQFVDPDSVLAEWGWHLNWA
jgi:hypothetical protein